MTPDRESLVVPTGRGLYCPAGDFYIDPCKPVQTAVITHSHGDHLCHGSARYILARPGAAIARHRIGADQRGIMEVDYGAPVRIGSTSVSLHPAGHILGSAQVRIAHAGRTWVISGDYKRQADPTCAPFEPLTCDVFVSEATFASPAFKWPATTAVVADIVSWWRTNRERGVASLLFCYALGKAQRVLAELIGFTDDVVYVHDAVGVLVKLYRKAGVRMVPTAAASAGGSAACRGALIIAPPGAAGTPWVRSFGAHSAAFCSGWMQLPEEHRRRGYDRGFVISDHADWPALVDTCTASGAGRILLMHGNGAELIRHLNARGIESSALSTPATAAAS